MFLAEIDPSLTAVRRLWLLRSGEGVQLLPRRNLGLTKFGRWQLEYLLLTWFSGRDSAAARKAIMSAFTITQLMLSCEAVQTHLLSLYICRPLVDRHLKKSCTCADRMVFLFTKGTSFRFGCYPCLVRINSSRRCRGSGCFWQRLTRA